MTKANLMQQGQCGLVDIIFDKDDGFKAENQLRFEFLNHLCPLIFAVILGLAFAVKKRFDYVLTITCVNRSKEYNEKVGGFKFSGHLRGYCLDIRTRDMPAIVREWILAFLESHWAKHFIYVIYHNHHIHIGVLRKDQTEDYSQYKNQG